MLFASRSWLQFACAITARCLPLGRGCRIRRSSSSSNNNSSRAAMEQQRQQQQKPDCLTEFLGMDRDLSHLGFVSLSGIAADSCDW